MGRLVTDIKILYVEDEELTRTHTMSVLSQYFTTVFAAEDAAKGLELFNSHPFDMIVTDIQLPGMDGFTLVEKIKETDEDIPVVVISAFSDREKFLRALDLKVERYLLKPIRVKELIHIIQKVAEDLVRRKEIKNLGRLLEQYKEAVDAGSIVSKTDIKGIITYVNNAFAELSGYGKEELVGKPHSLVRHPDMPTETFRELWETITAKKVWKGVIKNLKKDGGFYIVDATIVPITDYEGNISEYIAIRHDITELEEYKGILENQLDLSIQSMDDKMNQLKQIEKAVNASTAYTRTDINGVFTFANEHFCRGMGYAKEELVGRDCSAVMQFDNGLRDAISSRVAAKKEFASMIRYTTKTGEVRFYDTIFVPILDVEDNIIEVMGIHHDISEIIHLSQEIEDTQKEVVETMGAIGETRSRETGDHVRRVAEYSKLLAVLYGLDEAEANLLKLASPMHDIGKVGIPDAILNKPGKLDEAEFAVMFTHAEMGYEMLKHSQRKILKAAATVAREHHEKWDGSGYPRGLSGEDIHIYGRITAIADVFDALGHDRVYKKAWELQEILDLLHEERGRHFDPKLVDIFMENLDAILEIRDRFDKK